MQKLRLFSCAAAADEMEIYIIMPVACQLPRGLTFPSCCFKMYVNMILIICVL